VIISTVASSSRERPPRASSARSNVGDLDREAWTFAWWTSAIDEAIASAKKAQASWGSRSVDQRVATLRKLREPLRTRSEVLAQTMSRETGRPRWECRQEALTVVKELDAVLRAAPRELSSSRLLPPGCSARYKPRGVVASITAATQPALLAFSDIVAALAAGLCGSLQDLSQDAGKRAGDRRNRRPGGASQRAFQPGLWRPRISASAGHRRARRRCALFLAAWRLLER
jgi:hypothetical protein